MSVKHLDPASTLPLNKGAGKGLSNPEVECQLRCRQHSKLGPHALFFLVMPDPASQESGNDAAASITGLSPFLS